MITVLDGLKERGSIIAKEIKLVCLLWIYVIQHRYFEEVYAALKDKRKDSLQMQLGLNIDEFQILRCYEHYTNVTITREMKYPKLLPRKAHLQVL